MSEQAARPLASKHQYDKDVLISSHCQLCKIYVLSASKLLGLSWKLFSQSLSLVFCWLTLHRLEIERLGQDPVDIDGFKPCIYLCTGFRLSIMISLSQCFTTSMLLQRLQASFHPPDDGRSSSMGHPTIDSSVAGYSPVQRMQAHTPGLAGVRVGLWLICHNAF